MRHPVHFIPIITTVVAFVFAFVVYRRWRERGGTHLGWWSAGIVMYGVGTLTESLVTLFGWSPFIFKSWYIAGALLGAVPLAQGTVYLLLSRRTANILSALLVPYLVVAATFVLLTPLNVELAEPHRLSGVVMEWQRVRLFSPVVNIYAFIFLVGGAVLSAWRFRSDASTRNRFIGNVLIAIGAILPGIGGSATRAGYVEVLYVTELLGITLIWLGYRWNIRPSVPAASAEPLPQAS